MRCCFLCEVIIGLILLLPRPTNGAAPPPRDVRPLLDRLLIEYRALGLPLPPKGARLVQDHRINDDPRSNSLAWLVKDACGKKPSYLLCGTFQVPLKSGSDTAKAVDRRKAAAQAKEQGYHQSLFFALQCHSLGWTDLARTIAAQSGDRLSLEKLREHAWWFWEKQVFLPFVTRAEVARRMRVLMTIEPNLRKPYHEAMFESVQALLVPRKSKPGSVEAMIDELVEWDEKNGYEERDGDLMPAKDNPDERLGRLYFKAVPALIEHLEDKRLTRRISGPIIKFMYQMRVEHIVSEILESIACKKIGEQGLASPVSKTDALKWWTEAKKMGEEKYALCHVLPADGESFSASEDGIYSVNRYPVLILQKRYPAQLPGLYRKLLDDRPTLYSNVLARAIAESSLPLRVKRDVLLQGVRRKQLRHQVDAVRALKGLDHPLFVKLLIPMLERLPGDLPEPWYTEEVFHPCSLLKYTSDAQVWKTIDKVTRRAKVDVRLSLLQWPGYAEITNAAIRKRQLAYLASYLSDKEEGNQSESHRIAVRDLAAMLMAERLNIPFSSNEKTTAVDWARLREQVTRAWKRERDASPKANDKPTPHR
jgi:hypothetical protein